MTIEFCHIHIGKTGGSNLKQALKRHMKRHPEVEFGVFSHKATLRSLSEEHPESNIFFFVREPIKRFISGFNSRLRKGQPRYNISWNKDEQVAFAQYKTPKALAEALSAPSWWERRKARSAISKISHTRFDYTHYLGSVKLLEKNADRIVMIGQVETFDADFDWLKQLLNIDPDIGLTNDDVKSHSSPADVDTSMSELGAKNLRAHYTNDYAIYEWCLKRRAELKTQNAKGAKIE